MSKAKNNPTTRSNLLAFLPMLLIPGFLRHRNRHKQPAKHPTPNLDRKRAAKKARKAAAIVQIEKFNESLGLQCALIRLQLRAGNAIGSQLLAQALLESFVRTSYASLSGAEQSQSPLDKMVAKIRMANRITDEQMANLVNAIHQSQLPRVTADAVACTTLVALETIAFGCRADIAKKRSSRVRRQVREAIHAVEQYDARPIDCVTKEGRGALAYVNVN